MADQSVTNVLARLRAGACKLADLKEFVPPAHLKTDAWVPSFLHHPIKTLMTWGLVEAYNGFVRVTADELLKKVRPDDLPGIRFAISPTAAEIERAFGQNLWERGDSIFGEPLLGRWPDMFVVMPFDKALASVFQRHIKAVAVRAGLSVGRADDFFSSNSVMREIWSAICAATVIIADCTGRNANVFYEIGVAHAIGRRTILIAQTLEDVPFDLRHLRFVLYRTTPRGLKKFERDLYDTLQAVLPRRDGVSSSA